VQFIHRPPRRKRCANPTVGRRPPKTMSASAADLEALEPLHAYMGAFFADLRHGARARVAASFNREFAAAIDPASATGQASASSSSSSEIVSTFVDISLNREACSALLGPIFDAFGSSFFIPCRSAAEFSRTHKPLISVLDFMYTRIPHGQTRTATEFSALPS
jgi:hypothetical protein